MKTGQHPERGMALVFALMAIMVIMSALAIVMLRVRSSHMETEAGVDAAMLDEAARAGIDVAIEDLYNTYLQGLGNTTDNWGSFRSYLNNVREIPNTEDLNANGSEDANENNDNGRNGFEAWPGEYEAYGFPLLEDPVELTNPNTGTAIATIEQVFVVRNDDRFGTNLTIRAVAERNERRRAAVQEVRIGGVDERPGRFAVLAKNISCLLCHAQIRSLPLEYGLGDPGTHDRVKVASLESVLVRNNAEHSDIAGTLYTRGRVYRQDGSEWAEDALASNSDFRSYDFSTDDGTIVQSDSGDMTKVPFENADLDAEGLPVPFSNLYRDYGTESATMTDGHVPTKFPAPYPDEDGDRYVDDTEFQDMVESVDGSVRFELDETEAVGSVTAGVAYGVPRGSVYTGDELPTSSTSDATEGLADGAYDGNLILVGSNDDPIRIDKKVAVNGDLVIKGPIKGRGQIMTRGNVYIVGDVTYADDSDAPEDFGTFTENGVVKENAFSIVSGGSILMGDYLTIRGVNPPTMENRKYPDKKYSIRFDDEHRTAEVDGFDLEYGYFDEHSVDPNELDTSANHGTQLSFTQSELKLFNKIEIDKAVEDPSYVPRLYGLRESQPGQIFVYDNANEEHSVKYSESGVKLLTDYLVDNELPLDIIDRAAFHYMNPQGNWMSEDTLRNIWWEDEQSRPDLGGKNGQWSDNSRWRFDGLLYSNNAIFTMVRSKNRHGSHTYGQMEIRGGVIAPDLGVFAPGLFRLLYDARVEDFITAVDTEEVAVQRRTFYYVASAS